MKIMRELFNSTRPSEVSENGMQVALNITNHTKANDKGEATQGFLYDVVLFEETDPTYASDVKVEVAKVFEATDYLNKTEHKFNTDYELKADETPEIIAEIRSRRSAARAIVRAAKGE